MTAQPRGARRSHGRPDRRRARLALVGRTSGRRWAASGARRGTSASSSPDSLGIDFSDGTSSSFGPNDVFDIPPGHDGYTIGDEPCVQIEWSGIRAWAGFPTGIHSRVLRTLLFTDLVDSTQIAEPSGRRALARAPVRALRSRSRRARALSGTRGDDDGRRHRRDVRRPGAGTPLRGRHPQTRQRGRSPHPGRSPRRRGGARGRRRARASRCTRRRASWPRPARTRSSSPSSHARSRWRPS